MQQCSRSCSACHTAELTDKNIEDEALHLAEIAAAVQFCEFQSVVGTMWAMLDTDWWDLPRVFFTRRCFQAGCKVHAVMR